MDYVIISLLHQILKQKATTQQRYSYHAGKLWSLHIKLGFIISAK